MELKEILNKPYNTEKEFDFLCRNSYSKGYEIRETEVALEAWGPTKEEKEESERQFQIQEEINHLKNLLSNSDYQAIKYAEGWLTEEEYAPIKAQRESYRARIRELEQQL